MSNGRDRALGRRLSRRTAVKARTQTVNQFKALLVTTPAQVRDQLRGLVLPARPRAAGDN